MVVLCALSLATNAATVLQEAAQTDAEVQDIAEAVEVMKEILSQISVNPAYKDHTAAMSFCHCCLYTLRAVLLQWTTSTTTLQAMPMAKMPKTKGNAVWDIEHPNHAMFLAEIKSSVRFLSLHPEAFKEEPWIWLADFLETLEYHLAF